MAIASVEQSDTISIKIPHYLVERLDNVAKKEDRTRSSLIRRLISNYIEEYEDVMDALKARNEYEKNPKSAKSLDDLMSDMKVSKKELSKIKFD